MMGIIRGETKGKRGRIFFDIVENNKEREGERVLNWIECSSHGRVLRAVSIVVRFADKDRRLIVSSDFVIRIVPSDRSAHARTTGASFFNENSLF